MYYNEYVNKVLVGSSYKQIILEVYSNIEKKETKPNLDIDWNEVN